MTMNTRYITCSTVTNWVSSVFNNFTILAIGYLSSVGVGLSSGIPGFHILKGGGGV